MPFELVVILLMVYWLQFYFIVIHFHLLQPETNGHSRGCAQVSKCALTTIFKATLSTVTLTHH